MNNKTIHERAQDLLHIYSYRTTEWRENHPRCPEWIAVKCIAGVQRSIMRKAAREAVTLPSHARSHVTRDTVARRGEYREEMAVFCAGIRRETGLTGAALHSVARQMRQRYFCWGVNYSIFSAVPDSACGGLIGRIRATGQYQQDRHDVVWTSAWAGSMDGAKGHGTEALIAMALMDAVRLDIGERHAQQLLARLAANPSGLISGYLADDLSIWLSGRIDGRGGFEGCSGGEMYTWLRLHPETWPTLLAHVPVGQITDTAIQVYPHEHARANACAAAGLFHIFRMSDSIYTGTAAQVAAVRQQIAA